MTKNWLFAKITDILLNKVRSEIVSQNHSKSKILILTPNIYPFRCPRGKVRIKLGMTAKLNLVTNFGPPLTSYIYIFGPLTIT